MELLILVELFDLDPQHNIRNKCIQEFYYEILIFKDWTFQKKCEESS